MPDAINRLLNAVDGAWVADRAMELVSIPSVTLREEAVCRRFADLMREVGLSVEVREVTPGRNNLYARVKGEGGGPTLLFNGHLDTIPVGNCPLPRRDGDRIWGRGSTDMKGGLAAVLGAVRAILQTGIRLKGDLLVTAIVGHEEPEAMKDGPLALIEDIRCGRLSCDRILIAEGRDALWVMSMGSAVFTIRMESDRGGMHTQYVPFGDNPIRHMGELIRRIHERQRELDAGARHPLAGPERIDLGIASAGDYFNRTPLCCTLTGTRRWSPGKAATDILAELNALAAPFAKAGGLRLEVGIEHEREPFETPVDDPAVRAASEAAFRVTGAHPEAVGLRIVGDANLYVNEAGIPAFYYGPSNETAHSDAEWVSIPRLGSAAKVYALTAALYCGVAG